jgi:hypothetical protein
MKIKNTLVSIMVFLLVTAGVSAVFAQSDWKKLGDENVNFSVDHDRINVDDSNRIRELRLSVSDGPVKFRRVVINYKGGTKQDVEYIENIAVGAFSRTFMIEGDGQIVDSVEFWYETAGFSGKKAHVTLYGRSYTGPVMTTAPVVSTVVETPVTTTVVETPTSTTVVTKQVATAVVAEPVTAVVQGDWKRIGDKDVSHKLDHDTIDTNEKGRVREIRLSVMKAPVKFSRIVINYADGEKKEVDFVESVEMDKFSPTIAIEGDGHVIKSIDIWYETASMGGKQAKVVIYGRG